MDWSEKDSCIKCNDGGSLLVCCEDGCPIAVHERCLGFPAKFDDSGRFYCPYCLYRQAVAESRKAREYASARKKALLVFMDEKVIDSEKHVGGNVVCEENGHKAHNQSKASEENGNISSSDDGKSQSNDHGISDQPFQHDGGINDSAGSKGEDPSLEILSEKGNGIQEENHAREEDHESDAVEEEEHETNAAADEEDEEEIEEEKSETSSASEEEEEEEEEEIHARATRGSRRRQQMDKDSDDDSQRSKRLKEHATKKLTSATVNPTRRSSRKSSSMRAEKVKNEKVGSPRRLPPIKLASDVFGSGKRKRLLWTEEEEDELRAGVEKHAIGSTKLPWKKILNDSKKFHPTRTPSDLKDKWRTICRGSKRE